MELYRANFREIMTFAIFRPSIYLVSVIAMILVIRTGSLSVLNGSLSLGTLFVFITYISSFFEPIQELSEQLGTLQSSIASAEKIFSVLDVKPEIVSPTDPAPVNILGEIEFRHVWFAYEEENYILKDVSFTINPGESIALVGKTGSGKTTITNLINRFYKIQKGEILLDGVNINDINLKSLRKNIGTILQDPFIFAKSLKDNIKLYSDVSDERINEAVKLASATDFINSQNNGINEISAERGNSYSAGQKQLIAFARIFAQNPSIFILDEATANIDTTTEELIQKSVDKISAEKTSIFIAHRLSTIVNVDKIIVLNKGKILEQGNHSELLQKDGYYAKLYNAYYNSLN